MSGIICFPIWKETGHGLPEGTYTLHEELAPYADEYVSAADVEFEVLEDGSVTEVEMKDEYSKVEISKTDLTTGEELKGAKLQILNKDGDVLEEWETDGTADHLYRISSSIPRCFSRQRREWKFMRLRQP